MMVLRLAWRNLWRNPRRTLVILTAVAVGVFGMIFIGALMAGVGDQMVRNSIATLVGSLQIHQRGYRDDPVVENTMPVSVRAGGSPGIRAPAGGAVEPAGPRQRRRRQRPSLGRRDPGGDRTGKRGRGVVHRRRGDGRAGPGAGTTPTASLWARPLWRNSRPAWDGSWS